jgi:hypothetical protein
VYGHTLPIRQEIGADVSGGDGFAEVTFVMKRASRPSQYELLGTADAPPYRVFWRPPADLAPNDALAFLATVDDLRGHRASSQVGDVRVAATSIAFGTRGATAPTITLEPDPEISVSEGDDETLTVAAKGTEPLTYQWFHDGKLIPSASLPVLSLQDVAPDAAGHYLVLVRNREATAVSRDIQVTVTP